MCANVCANNVAMAGRFCDSGRTADHGLDPGAQKGLGRL